MPKSVLSKPAFEAGANRLRRTLLCALLAALPLAQAAAEDAAPAKPRSMQEILDAWDETIGDAVVADYEASIDRDDDE